jgi:hypothetical protein
VTHFGILIVFSLTRRCDEADGWAIFDTCVITVSVVLLIIGNEGGNSWVKQLRVLRAFRLFRLLGKMGDLKKIVTAVAMSIAPTLQALVSAPPLLTPITGKSRRFKRRRYCFNGMPPLECAKNGWNWIGWISLASTSNSLILLHAVDTAVCPSG